MNSSYRQHIIFDMSMDCIETVSTLREGERSHHNDGIGKRSQQSEMSETDGFQYNHRSYNHAVLALRFLAVPDSWP